MNQGFGARGTWLLFLLHELSEFTAARWCAIGWVAFSQATARNILWRLIRSYQHAARQAQTLTRHKQQIAGRASPLLRDLEVSSYILLLATHVAACLTIAPRRYPPDGDLGECLAEQP